jgi:erythromycin esterase-like protein
VTSGTPLLATRALARRLDGARHDYDGVLELAAGKRYVLLGEATHGTAEFYRLRADITQRLIVELKFDAIAIEGDWPDAWRVNQFVTHEIRGDADAALAVFERFPQWMWRNRQVRELVWWLHDHNAGKLAAQHVGFYGLDLYSLYRSAEAVIGYLDEVDPEAAQQARRRYVSLDHVRDAQTYGYQVARSLRPSSEAAVQRQLEELRARAEDYRRMDGVRALDAQFAAERNAAAVVNAEQYYRTLYGGRVNSWNLRDAHMRDTLFALADYRLQRGGSGRVVVWAHNSHLGDARATEMHRRGEWNLGQLVREAAPGQSLAIGFTTYTGSVAAASEWDGDVELKRIRPALPGSYERLFHDTRLDRFFLPLVEPDAAPLAQPMLERAIGVLYRPQTERASHYFEASLASQFDAVFHLDETYAVEPLAAPQHWPRQHQAPVTYPSAL